MSRHLGDKRRLKKCKKRVGQLAWSVLGNLIAAVVLHLLGVALTRRRESTRLSIGLALWSV